MRSTPRRYPLDRYLVENNKKFEMVNIIDDEIWNPEPALKPEDEIILRKLHEMLQSTANDLKLLSGELTKYHEPNVHAKTLPTPLDEEFNEKVHIQELVNAKFHGLTAVNKFPVPLHNMHNPYKVESDAKLKKILRESKVDAAIQTHLAPKNKTITRRNLEMSRTKIVQINETKDKKVSDKNDRYNDKECNKTPTVAYNEIFHKYFEQKDTTEPVKALNIQEMPSVNIRSELKPQKVLQIDILPSSKPLSQEMEGRVNVAVITVQHKPEPVSNTTKLNTGVSPPQDCFSSRQPIRKVFKMSAYESSESTNNVSSENMYKISNKQQRRINSVKILPKHSDEARSKTLKYRKSNGKQISLDEWKRKLNSVYGQSSKIRPNKVLKSKSTSEKVNPPASSSRSKPPNNLLNNAEYIPYSQLTLGGITVSDIEKEISDLPIKSDLPLSPILDKILSSRENSFYNEIQKISRKMENNNVLSKSDEKLLQEVIDIENKVDKTLTKRVDKVDEISFGNTSNADSDKNDSYVDDFEESKSDNHSQKQIQTGDENEIEPYNIGDAGSAEVYPDKSRLSSLKTTHVKSPNLSFKNTVDIHEYVHSVDTQDTATQSNTSQKILPKETQTSPRNDRSNIQPIHNDLWPTSDPLREIEKMFKLEKDLIKKIIIDEYGDLLEKDITKPSTSKGTNETTGNVKNIANFQKKTQTSPARVKNVMTSPLKTKTRTTSPFTLSLTVDRQTSPLASEDNLKVEIENGAEDLGISINLSSPRFSLRLPQTSREVISNLEACSQSSLAYKDNSITKAKKPYRQSISSSSSAEVEDSSDISSLGEVNFKLKSKFRSRRNPSISEASSPTSVSKWDSSLDSGSILPLRSEGEVSLGQTLRKLKKSSKSDGEVNNTK